jgi:hexosaminidase
VADGYVLDKAEVWRMQAYVGDTPIQAERRVEVVQHLASGRPIRLAFPANRQYPGSGPGALTDGLRGGLPFNDGIWQGWEGPDLDAVIDLGAPTAVHSVQLTALQNQRTWIVLPSSVDISISDDGILWTTLGRVEHTIDPQREEALIHPFVLTLPAAITARYVGVTAHNFGPLPAWHQGAGRRPWIFADEIVVR